MANHRELTDDNPMKTQTRQGTWYLVQCKPRQDERAEENLTRQGYECYRPVCPRPRVPGTKEQKSPESLFPGYVFINLPADTSWAPLRSTRGVTRIVGFGGQPLSISAQLIEQLRVRSQMKAPCRFSPGDKVVILDEGFAGLEAIFLATDGEHRVILLVNLLNRQHSIKLPANSIVSG